MTMRFYKEDGTEIGIDTQVSADDLMPTSVVDINRDENNKFLEAWDRIKPNLGSMDQQIDTSGLVVQGLPAYEEAVEADEVVGIVNSFDRFYDRNGNEVTPATKLDDLSDSDRAKLGLPELDI